ncbi:MAG: type 1 glutamine amidotransferase [Candidatus Nanopelagicaceae bacterium]
MTSTHALPVIVAIQNGAAGPVNLVGKWLTELGFEIRTIHAYTMQPLPETIEDLDELIAPSRIAAIIPLGGSIGALDDERAPWLPRERALLKDAVTEGVPVLGICLGAQLLGVSLDGTLGKAAQPEIGIYDISISAEDDPIFGALAGSGAVPSIQWHQDMVTELPKDSMSIASSGNCQNQIYRVGEIHYGLQFHPEADPTIVGMWEKKADEAYQRSDRRQGIADEVAAHMNRLEEIWKPAIKRWGEMVLDLLETRPRQPTLRQR